MLKTIKIIKLFGKYDYELDLLSKKKLMILTSLNGFGKTTIFNIVDSILNDRLYYLARLKFKEIIIETENKKIIINKGDFSLFINDEEFVLPSNLDDIINTDFRGVFRPINIKPEFVKTYVSSEELFNTSVTDDNDKSIFLEDRIIVFNCVLRYDQSKEKNSQSDLYKQFDKVVDEILTIRKEIGKFIYIKDNRLYDFENSSVVSARAPKISKEIEKKMQDAIYAYHDISSKLDANFITDLHKKTNRVIDEIEYNSYFTKLSKITDECEKFGLNDISLPKNKYKSEYKNVYSLYFENIIKKMKVFSELLEKMNVFVRIINTNFYGKKAIIYKNKGLYFVDNITEETIDINSLSSGEKNLLILYYDLVFLTNDGALLLIDEPELSLHLAWQKNFIDNLIDINDLFYGKNNRGFQAIVSTHAPAIISNHWEDVIDLTFVTKKDE